MKTVKEPKPARPYISGDDYFATIVPAIKKFEADVWIGKGVAEQVRASTCRGQIGTAGDFTVMLYTIAARTMITIHDNKGDWLSVMVAEHSTISTMGLHERSIETDQIIPWLEKVTAGWKGVADDPKVKLDVLYMLDQGGL